MKHTKKVLLMVRPLKFRLSPLGKASIKKYSDLVVRPLKKKIFFVSIRSANNEKNIKKNVLENTF